MQVYRDNDLTANALAGRRVAVIGYGNQGHAHALNLRDSGIDVTVGARPGGDGWRRAEADGFVPRDVADAVADADVVAVLLPDEIQGQAFTTRIQPSLQPGAALVFAHGFTIAFGMIRPPSGHDVILVAPKGQGHYLRASYGAGEGLFCLVAHEHDASGQAHEVMLSYAQALGCLKAGAIRTTFREEAITDLFGEQAVLCGGVPALVKVAFDTLVTAGYSPDVAYIECLHELKIITDLMACGGVSFMRDRISRTAAWGSYSAEERLITEDVRGKLKAMLESIESGSFAAAWQEEASRGAPTLAEKIQEERRHGIEAAGKAVRALALRVREDAS